MPANLNRGGALYGRYVTYTECFNLTRVRNIYQQVLCQIKLHY